MTFWLLFEYWRENGGTIGKRKGGAPEFVGVSAFHNIIGIGIYSTGTRDSK